MWSIMTKIEANQFLVRGEPNTKSKLRSSQIDSRIDRRRYIPTFFELPLLLWHTSQCQTNL